MNSRQGFTNCRKFTRPVLDTGMAVSTMKSQLFDNRSYLWRGEHEIVNASRFLIKQPDLLGQFQFNKFVKALYGLNPNRVGNLTLLAR